MVCMSSLAQAPRGAREVSRCSLPQLAQIRGSLQRSLRTASRCSPPPRTRPPSCGLRPLTRTTRPRSHTQTIHIYLDIAVLCHLVHRCFVLRTGRGREKDLVGGVVSQCALGKQDNKGSRAVLGRHRHLCSSACHVVGYLFGLGMVEENVCVCVCVLQASPSRPHSFSRTAPYASRVTPGRRHLLQSLGRAHPSRDACVGGALESTRMSSLSTDARVSPGRLRSPLARRRAGMSRLCSS